MHDQNLNLITSSNQIPLIRLETDSGMTAFTGLPTVITSIAARLNVSVTSENLGTPSHSIWSLIL